MIALVLADHTLRNNSFNFMKERKIMRRGKKEKYWSLKIPINLSKIDKEMKEYLLVCKEKLGMVPNILKTNTIDKKSLKYLIFSIID